MDAKHIAKIINANEFEASSFVSDEMDKGVTRYSGEIKKTGVRVAQSYKFDESFTAETAKKWLKKNSITYVALEEAQTEQMPEEIKLGARNSAADMATIQKAHDLVYEAMHHMRSLGAAKPVASPYKSELESWVETEFGKQGE